MTPDQQLEQDMRRMRDLMQRAAPLPLETAKLIETLCIAFAPVVREHVAREVTKATAPLERRLAELEKRQPRRGGVKMIREGVRCL